jgi:hypothetical protein
LYRLLGPEASRFHSLD